MVRYLLVNAEIVDIGDLTVCDVTDLIIIRYISQIKLNWDPKKVTVFDVSSFDNQDFLELVMLIEKSLGKYQRKMFKDYGALRDAIAPVDFRMLRTISDLEKHARGLNYNGNNVEFSMYQLQLVDELEMIF